MGAGWRSVSNLIGSVLVDRRARKGWAGLLGWASDELDSIAWHTNLLHTDAHYVRILDDLFSLSLSVSCFSPLSRRDSLL